VKGVVVVFFVSGEERPHFYRHGEAALEGETKRWEVNRRTGGGGSQTDLVFKVHKQNILAYATL
jgi:hypothetical protein